MKTLILCTFCPFTVKLVNGDREDLPCIIRILLSLSLTKKYGNIQLTSS